MPLPQNDANDSIAVAKINDISVIDHNNIDTTYKIVFEFDLVATIVNNVTNVQLYLDTDVDNQALQAFMQSINRKRQDFASEGAYINYVNNINSAYSRISDAIELERSGPNKYIKIGSAFNPLFEIDDAVKDAIRRLQNVH